MSVSNSRLFYAVPKWVDSAVKYRINVKNIIKFQRTAALRVTRAYRTVLVKVAPLLSNTTPGNLLALEKSRIRSRIKKWDNTESPAAIRASERDITINGWQNRWDRCETSSD